MRDGKLRKFLNYIIRRTKKNSRIRDLEHSRVVIGISRRDHLKVLPFKCYYRFGFTVRLAEAVIGDASVVVHDQFVTE